MAITASKVKELREMTGAGMMDCKKALTATDGDMDKAVEFLREKGLATAQKKAGRIAAEGICKTLVSADEKSAVVVEVNAETDFVAKNEKFQDYVAQVAEAAMEIQKQLQRKSLWHLHGNLMLKKLYRKHYLLRSQLSAKI